MTSSSIANPLIPSSARMIPRRNELPAAARTARRSYVTQRPLPMSNGGNNRALLIASLVAIPALAYFMIPSRPAKPRVESRETGNDRRHVVHPEDEDPKNFKPAFGQVHQQKRVDMPPDGRHHQALHDKARERAQD
ncbi:hypothetical protein F5Y14DRAFT_315001 [Nemania sp. NC0429]|nr:hypothetical protein F5Y14DRAFT_315001 [Nemania sp. NC0429]